ncbi:conserved protein of unknown function [Ralstonia solanacearum CMR15]|nr:conserved protein of unknown function [Ralstonia solanacearum CMR15]
MGLISGVIQFYQIGVDPVYCTAAVMPMLHFSTDNRDTADR